MFVSAIQVSYRFEAPKKLRFVVIDIDKVGGKMEEQRLIGTIISFFLFLIKFPRIFLFFFLNCGDYETTAAQIIAAVGQSWIMPLVPPSGSKKAAGLINVTAEEVRDFSLTVHFHFAGKKLDRKDFFKIGRSDPFLRISRKRSDNTWERVHQVRFRIFFYIRVIFN